PDFFASIHGVTVTPDGKRAIASFSLGDVAFLDLERVAAPPRLSVSELRRLGELTSVQRIELGDLSGLTVDQWIERWDLLTDGDSNFRRWATPPQTAHAPEAGTPDSAEPHR